MSALAGTTPKRPSSAKQFATPYGFGTPSAHYTRYCTVFIGATPGCSQVFKCPKCQPTRQAARHCRVHVVKYGVAVPAYILRKRHQVSCPCVSSMYVVVRMYTYVRTFPMVAFPTAASVVNRGQWRDLHPNGNPALTATLGHLLRSIASAVQICN